MKIKLKTFSFITLVITVIFGSIFLIKNTFGSEENQILDYPITSYNFENLSKEQQAILNTALAFYYRGNNLQYYSANLTYNSQYGNYGHELHIIPEDATENNILNTDCTTFVYSVFENAFVDNAGNGYKLGGFDKGKSAWLANLANPSSSTYNSLITKYYSTSPSTASSNDFNILDTDTKEEKANKFIEATNLEPGDIIVERYSDGSGHAFIYLGNDLLINSSQTVNYRKALSYMFDEKHYNYNDYGTVGFISLKDNLVSTTSGQINKYIFSTSLTKLAVISPLKEIEANNYKVSDSAIIRKRYPHLVISKLASKKRTESVNLKDQITYEIKLKNKGGTTYNNILITDIIPTNTEYISCDNNCTYNNKNIEWNNITLNANEEKTYSYTVKVSNDETLLGDYIISNNTKVNGMEINTIKIKINNTLNNDIQNEIKNIITDKISDNKIYNDNIANLVYSELNNSFNFFKNKTANDIINQYFETYKRCFYEFGNNNCSEYDNPQALSQELFEFVGSEKKTGYGLKNTYTLKESQKDMLVDRFYGGVMMTKEYDTYTKPDMIDDRLIRITENDFMIGDILIMYDDDYEREKETNYDILEKGIYLYIGDGNFATISDNGKLIIIDEKTSERVSIYYKDKGEEYITDRYKYIFDDGSQVKNVLACKILKLPGESKYAYFGKEGNQLTDGNIRKIYNEECNTTDNVSCKVDTASSNSTNYYYNKNGEKVDFSTYNTECVPYYLTNRSKLVDSLNGQNVYLVLRPSYITEFQKYTITYDANNKTNEMVEKTFFNNETITLNNNDFVYDGYKFVSWNTSPDGKGTAYSNGETIKINNDLHLYAIWEKEFDYVINNYPVDETNKYISEIMVNTSIDAFKSNVSLGTGYSVDIDYKEINNSKVLYTGGKTRIMKAEELYREYTNIVIGDINGDGAINSADLLKIRQHLLRTSILSGPYFLSSDINYDNEINSADLLRVRQHLLGIKPIE